MSDQLLQSTGVGGTTGDLPAAFGSVMTDFWTRTSLGLCMIDARGVIVAANPVFCAVLGRSAAEMVGTSVTGLIAAEAAALGLQSHVAFINGDDSAVKGLTYLHKNGRPLLTHATNTRVRLPDGRVFRLTSLVDLAGEAKGMGPLVDQQRAENFSTLAANISNDFNNLLSIILGYTAFLRDASLDTARLNTAVDGIDHAVRRAANLVRQTQHLSRRDELSCRPTALGTFVREFYRMSGETLTTGLDFSLVVEEDIPSVSLDPQHFHHALVNLGQKARDMVGGGGRMKVDVRRVDGKALLDKFPDARGDEYVMVALRAEPPADKLADGEEPGVWDKAVVFAEHRRDLSVMVVHGIMAGHCGHLEVDARSGPALVFRLYLPALADAGVETARALPATGVAASGETVLLVGDGEPSVETLKSSLERDGFRIVSAHDGLEGWALFGTHAEDISLVLIDLGLPRMGGWEIFRKIRQKDPSMKILVMDGPMGANLRAEIMKVGACGFLQKPLALPEALAEVRRACARRA